MSIRNLTLTAFLAFTRLGALPAWASASPQVPVAFVENRGQTSPSVRYLATGPAFTAWFEDSGVTLQRGDTTIRITFHRASGKNPLPPIIVTSDHPTGAIANFISGNSSRNWRTGLPLYSSIHYTGIWQGVELTYKVEHDTLKAEYTVAPGAEPGQIQLQIDGAARIQEDGSLRIQGTPGESNDVSNDFIEDRPVIYQSIAGTRREIGGGFRQFPDGSIGFRIANYDHSEPLVIDPAILFSGYFGGTSQDTITGVAIDSLNNIVTAGFTSSHDLPAHGARTTNGGGVDAFVAAFLPNGGGMIYCTYLGGSGDDRAFGVAVDSARNVYVTGWTSSTNFPVASAIQTRLSGTRDAFVTKLNPTGSALVYSTYLGGSGVDVGYGIAVTSTFSAVVVGDTTSTNLATTPGVFQPRLAGGQDVFVATIAPAGSLTYLSYLGGNGQDHASSVRVGSAAGAIFIGGYTFSTNFPVVKAYQSRSGGGQDGFVTRMYPAENGLSFSTYLGGSGGSTGAPEEVTSVALDVLSNVTVAGTTSSANFPVTPNVVQPNLAGQTDGFITRFTSGGVLLQSTYLGGSLSDGINAVALDFHGNPYVTGYTSSLDFPAQRPVQNSNNGLMDAVVVKLNPTLTTIQFGTYLGGSGSDSGTAIAIDAQTSIVVAGQTGSGDFAVSGSLQSALPATLSSFITKIAPNFTLGVGYAYQGQMTFTADPWHVASYTASASYGTATDIPITGDWTGSGVKRIGVFRNGTWILDTNGNGVLDAADKTVVFGQAGDVPVVADWRGTGQIALGLFRNGTFILDLSGHLSGTPTGLQDATFVFGQGGDVPVAADWNGSGTAKVGVFRNGLWLLDYNGDHVYNSSDRAYTYGQAGDVPVVGDWDSSGIPNKIGIYRAGVWVLDYDGDGVWTTPGLTEMTIGFGFAGYTPLIF